MEPEIEVAVVGKWHGAESQTAVVEDWVDNNCMVVLA